MNERQANLRQNLRALPRGAWILFIGTFLNKFGTFVLPFLAIYMTGMGFSSAQAGLAIAFYGIGSFCASLLGGHLADRIGRRKTIVLSMFSGAVSMICLSQVRHLPLIVVFSGLTGLTGELYRPACSALLADLVPSGQRVTAFGAYRMTINAGFAFGSATAGLIAKTSFGWLFIGDAATSVLFGLVAWLALPSGLRGTRTDNSLLETYHVLRRDERFRQVICATLIIGVVIVQILSTMSVEIIQSGFSPAVYGLMISLNGILIVLLELPLTSFTKHFAPRRVMALGFFLIGAGFASNALPRTLPLLVVTMVIFTFGEMIAMPISAAYVADLAPAHQRGLYMGTYGLTWSFAFVCGPSLGMLLFSASRIGLWTTCGLLGLLATRIILSEPRTAIAGSKSVDSKIASPQPLLDG